MSYIDSIFDKEISLEYKMERLRIWRNSELKETDWTMISDATTDKAAWTTYRQALRDLPTNPNLSIDDLPTRPN
jgi:hypothetical protein